MNPTTSPLLAGLAVSNVKIELIGLSFLIALFATIFLTPVAIWLARKAGVMDKPDPRRVHKTPTPRWGGLAMFTAFVITVLIVFHPGLHPELSLAANPRVQGVLIGAFLITLVGALDDKFQVPAKVKLGGQVLTAALIVFFGIRFLPYAPDNPVMAFNSPMTYWASVIFSVLWIVAITNTVNLIDGLDGLAAGVSGIAALSFLVINMSVKGTLGFAILAAALIGVCMGFLRYNFHPAKVFMGDAGSHFLGFTIAMLSILQNWKVATATVFAVPILILAVPIFDTAFAIVRRMIRHQPIFMPDRGHLHHRLLSMGLKQRTVVLTIYLLTGLGCLFAVMLAWLRS